MGVKYDKVTEYSKIYDVFYKRFADQMKYEIKNSTKVKIIDDIFQGISWDDQQAIRACTRYRTLDSASKNTKIPKKQLVKQYELATRHMYYPSNISKAVPKYYKYAKYKHLRMHLLTVEDFDGKKYILNALNKKSGIYYREQLMIHLSNGYYFLWTLPGCGDGARMSILMAIDKWNGTPAINPDSRKKLGIRF